jgi:hypothetical protein
MRLVLRGAFLASVMQLALLSKAQEKPGANTEELAKKLANPIGGLISVPLQNNIDYDMGSFHGSKYTLNFQPVIPIQLSGKFNLITRYIIPIVDQHDISKEGESQSGLSDATVSAFFTPISNKAGPIWGAGPAFLFPTGTNDFLSARKWAIGPTFIILKQATGLTYGFLANQLWSFAGDESRSDINQMFFQPFLTHNWKSGAGISLSSEMNFNWQANTTIISLDPSVSAVTKLGKQAASVALGPRIPLAAPSGSKPDVGLRATLTFVFPK